MLLRGVLPLLCTSIVISQAPKCENENEVYTGKKGQKWIAIVNKEINPSVLYPNHQTIFASEHSDVNEIVVNLDMRGVKLELEEVSIESKNAKEIRIQGLGRHEEIKASPVLWVKSRFKFTGQKVNGITIIVISKRGEVAVKNVFVKGCAAGGWCNWGSWSQCSVTCGGGSSSRTRVCYCQVPSQNPFTCKGDNKMSKSCSTDQCPNPLVVFFNAKLKVFSDLWAKGENKKLVYNFYTKDAMVISNDEPIVQDRQTNIDRLQELMQTTTVSDLEVVTAVQMSEIRIYTVHNSKWYNVDKTKQKGRGRLFIVWKLVDGDWYIDVLSKTRGEWKG